MTSHKPTVLITGATGQIGGDTTRGPLCLTLTVFGRVPSGQALTDKIQDACGNHPGDNIVDHDPHAAMHIAIKPADRPRLPHIQNTENHKPGGNPLPVIGRQCSDRCD